MKHHFSTSPSQTSPPCRLVGTLAISLLLVSRAYAVVQEEIVGRFTTTLNPLCAVGNMQSSGA